MRDVNFPMVPLVPPLWPRQRIIGVQLVEDDRTQHRLNEMRELVMTNTNQSASLQLADEFLSARRADSVPPFDEERLLFLIEAGLAAAELDKHLPGSETSPWTHGAMAVLAHSDSAAMWVSNSFIIDTAYYIGRTRASFDAVISSARH